MIIFKSIKYKNFLGTGNAFTEILLNSHNANLIVGKNGSGKSTFLDAISYALFGVEFRDINKPQLLNSINKKNMVVELNFEVGSNEYLVRRGMKPTIFEIWKNGEMLPQPAKAADYQKHLEIDIVKMSHKSLRQIVVLGSAEYVPFMKLDAKDRRVILEDLLDLQIFSGMNTVLKRKVDTNVENLKELDYQIRLSSEMIESQKNIILKFARGNSDSSGSINEKITDIQNMIKAQLESVYADQKLINETSVHLLSSPETIKEKASECGVLLFKLGEKIKTLSDEKNFYLHTANCPLCKQNISEEFRHSMIRDHSDKLSALEINLKKVQLTHKRYTDMINQNGSLIEIIRNHKTKIQITKADIESKKSFLEELDRQLSSLNSNAEEALSQERTKLQTQLFDRDYLVKQRDSLIKEKSVLDYAAILLKDGGIKAKIIKQYIPVINTLINKYLSILDLPVGFNLDENFKETLTSRFRDEFSYGSFSEGEKKRIDLAILFSWREIAKMRNSAHTNLLILDEIMDGALDTDGIEQLAAIFEKVFVNENVFVISHRESMLDIVDGFDNVIEFRKINDFSRMIENGIN